MYESEGVQGSLDAASDAIASADTCCTDAPQQYEMYLYRCVDWHNQGGMGGYYTKLATYIGQYVKAPSDCMRKCTNQDHSHDELMCNGVVVMMDTRTDGVDHCILMYFTERIYNDVPTYCTPQTANDVWRTYLYNPDLVTTTCSSGAATTVAPYFEGILAHRTQIDHIKVIPKAVAGSAVGANTLERYIVSYRLHPNQSPWTHLGTMRCYGYQWAGHNPLGKTEAIMDDAPTPLTAASAAECRTLTERHPLIHGHVPDMYRFHPTLGAQNCVPQKMQGSTQHPLFFPKDCFANDGGWETYVHDLNFPSELDRFPPSPPPSPAPPPPPFGFRRASATAPRAPRATRTATGTPCRARSSRRCAAGRPTRSAPSPR